MSEADKEVEDMSRDDIAELDDEELAETYKSIMKAQGFINVNLDKIISQAEEYRQRNDIGQQKVEKAEKNAEEAQEQKKMIENRASMVKDEVAQRDIDPYDY